MRIFKTFAIAAALLIGLSSVSQASVFYDNLTIGGGDDELSDSSLGYFVNQGDLTKIDAGDLIRGVVAVDKVNGVDTSSVLYAMYELEVATASTTSITVKNGDVMSWLTSTQTGVVDNRTIGGSTDQSFVIIENLAGAGLSPTDADYNSITLVGDDIKKDQTGGAGDAFEDWTVQLTGGFRLPTDGYTITVDTAFAGSYGNAASPNHAGVNELDNLLDVAAWGQGLKIGDFTGFFSITGWDQTQVPGWKTVSAIPGGGQLQIINGQILNATDVANEDDDETDRGWTFSDRGDFFVNPVPEPSTIAIWAVAGIGAVGFGVRRRMKAKKA